MLRSKQYTIEKKFHFTQNLLAEAPQVYFFELMIICLYPLQKVKYPSIEESWEKAKAAGAGFERAISPFRSEQTSTEL